MMMELERHPVLRRFEGKRVLVTGAGSGIGRAVVLRLATEGANVAVTGRRAGPLEETAGLIERIGASAVVLPGDVTVEANAKRIVAGVIAQLAGLDVVVNCAGTIRRGTFAHELPAESFDDQIRDNLRSVFLVTRAALVHMLSPNGPGESHRGGAIVNIASTLAHTPGSGVSAYVASKGAVVSFTKAIAHEYANAGIRVNCVCPATIRTPMAYADRPDFDKMVPELEAFYPLGRLGEVDDVTGAVAYLASDDARWVTGAVLDVDGGLSVR